MAECGKKSYVTFQHATNDAHEVSMKHDDAAAQVYRCRHCQAWHVGTRIMAKMRKPRPKPPSLYDLDGLDT